MAGAGVDVTVTATRGNPSRRQPQQDLILLAWSQHDFAVVADGRGSSEFRQRHLVDRYRDGRETAKKWGDRDVVGMTLPPGKKHTLDRYQRMIGYEVPPELGVGHTGANL